MPERLTKTLDWLYSLEARGEISKLQRMENALALIGNPHRRLRAVHIAGTKGKGSVAAMLDAIARIERYGAGLDREAFLTDEKTADAVARNLEVLGEAAARLPEATRATVDEIPWRRIVGLRNRIVHEYFGIDLEIVWEIVTADLPDLQSQLTDLRRQQDA